MPSTPALPGSSPPWTRAPRYTNRDTEKHTVGRGPHLVKGSVDENLVHRRLIITPNGSASFLAVCLVTSSALTFARLVGAFAAASPAFSAPSFCFSFLSSPVAPAKINPVARLASKSQGKLSGGTSCCGLHRAHHLSPSHDAVRISVEELVQTAQQEELLLQRDRLPVRAHLRMAHLPVHGFRCQLKLRDAFPCVLVLERTLKTKRLAMSMWLALAESPSPPAFFREAYAAAGSSDSSLRLALLLLSCQAAAMLSRLRGIRCTRATCIAQVVSSARPR